MSNHDEDVYENTDETYQQSNQGEEEEKEKSTETRGSVDEGDDEGHDTSRQRRQQRQLKDAGELEYTDEKSDIALSSATNKKRVQVRGESLDEDRETTAVVNDKDGNDDGIENSSINGDILDQNLKDSLHNANRSPNTVNSLKLSQSKLLSNLMDTYLDKEYVNTTPTLQKPRSASVSEQSSDEILKAIEIEKNLKNIRMKNKKQPAPPVRNKPMSRTWEDPREQQRLKVREKQWPPKEPPKDIGSYVVESYGQTDPYTKRLIKDIQRSKREEEERREAEKRAEILTDNTKPVSTLRDTFTHRPKKSAPGRQRPQVSLNTEKSWIQHEKKPVIYDNAPEEPDWMKLIRNRRWKSTVKARFPCKDTDRTEFDRRSTTPKNWKKLARDKNAIKMLSEMVGVGAEGGELFMRLASQRQKVDNEQEEMDSLAQQEILAYQVARESLGEDTAYSLQMDNPLPAARMKRSVSMKGGSISGSTESLADISQDALLNYPFTTSQLEAAYLTNQLLRLHPEEFRKLISLERSRQATLRWQFSSDPFDSVHDHQDLPIEMALLATDEPRILQAMRKIVGQGSTDDYRSVFSSTVPTPQPRYRRQSEGAYQNYYYESDGYESSNSVSSSSSVGVVRGRPRKKKKPVPLPPLARSRGRSVSPSMTNRPSSRSSTTNSVVAAPSGKILPFQPSVKSGQLDEQENEVQAHSLFDDADLQLEDEIANLDQLTSNLARNIDEELKGIETSVEDRKKGFFQEAIRNEHSRPRRSSVTDEFDMSEISNRRQEMMEKARVGNVPSDTRADLPKTRHKVRRIKSDAQLNAVFRKRREMSEVDSENKEPANEVPSSAGDVNTSKEISNVLNDINQTYGD